MKEGLTVIFALLQMVQIAAGATVLPHAWDSLPPDPSARAQALRETVEAVSAAAADPVSAASDCAAFSQVWLEKLNLEKGYRLIYAETAGMGEVKLASGATLRRDKTHYFLADRTACGSEETCDGEIIIDPTYMQFLEGGDCLYGETGGACAAAEPLRGLPKVLVGTRAEIKSFYAALAGRVRLYPGSAEPESGKYDAASAASLIYSFGHNSALRSNIEIFFGAEAPAKEKKK